MGKKRKRQFNVRLKEETFFTIQDLAGRWECSQAEVVERLAEGHRVPGRGVPIVVSEEARESVFASESGHWTGLAGLPQNENNELEQNDSEEFQERVRVVLDEVE